MTTVQDDREDRAGDRQHGQHDQPRIEEDHGQRDEVDPDHETRSTARSDAPTEPDEGRDGADQAGDGEIAGQLGRTIEPR